MTLYQPLREWFGNNRGYFNLFLLLRHMSADDVGYVIVGFIGTFPTTWTGNVSGLSYNLLSALPWLQ